MPHKLDESIVIDERTAGSIGVTNADELVDPAKLLGLALEDRVEGRA